MVVAYSCSFLRLGVGAVTGWLWVNGHVLQVLYASHSVKVLVGMTEQPASSEVQWRVFIAWVQEQQPAKEDG